MSERNKKIIKVTSSLAPFIVIVTMLILRHGSLSTQMVIGIIGTTVTVPLFLLCLYANVKGIKSANLWLTLAFLTILVCNFAILMDSYWIVKGINDKYLTVFSPSIMLLLMFFVYMSAKDQYSVEKRNKLKKKLVFPLIGYLIFQFIMIYGNFFKGK